VGAQQVVISRALKCIASTDAQRDDRVGSAAVCQIEPKKLADLLDGGLLLVKFEVSTANICCTVGTGRRAGSMTGGKKCCGRGR
jgi:hypothetical protein